MKTVMLFLLAMSPVMSPGCWPGWLVEPEPPPAAPAITNAPLPPRPPVTADKVNTGNAREMAEALREEIDREQGGGR